MRNFSQLRPFEAGPCVRLSDVPLLESQTNGVEKDRDQP